MSSIYTVDTTQKYIYFSDSVLWLLASEMIINMI